MKKRIRSIILVVTCTLFLCSCAHPNTASNSDVANVLNSGNTDDSELTENINSKQSDATQSEDNTKIESNKGKTIDLTVMGKDMVYATVYQLVYDAKNYVGTTVKMSGKYYSSYDELTQKTYRAVIISDATACCSQGIEYILADESMGYPEEGSEVVVTGVLEVYVEQRGNNSYSFCRLIDCR